MGRARLRWWCALLAVAGAALGGSATRALPQVVKCDLDAPADCCQHLPASALSCDAGAPASARSPRKKNVVLILADDSGYCHHGFMQGMCSESSKLPCPDGVCAAAGELCTRGRCIKPCVSNIACTGICGSSADLMADVDPDERPLRLDDPGCRNRQPPRPGKDPLGWCAENTDETGHFVFRRDFPCAGTPGIEDHHVRTPHLDALASEGAVFTRAHVPGDSCKPARVGILLGMQNVHAHDLAGSSVTCDLDDPLSFNGIGCFLPEHRSYLWGKGDVGTARTSGFAAGSAGGNPSLGKLRGACRPINCEQRLQVDRMPVRVPEDVVPPPPDALVSVSGIDDRIFPRLESELLRADDAQGRNAHLTQPFFIWYAPNIPHDGGVSPRVFRKWYDPRLVSGDPTAPPREKKSFEFLGRVSLFDVGVGALVDALRRRCVCDADGNPASLYDNTVLVYLHETGVVLPEAKQRPSENGHRTPIVINEPGHRRPGTHVPPRQVAGELASGTDLLATIVAYASEPAGPPLPPTDPDACGPAPDQQGYPFVRSLCRAVKGDPTPVRRLLYGHDSDVPLATGEDRYVVT
ncbi:MAG TPA: sulfatase-like hydrolase/transferase, partial [Candidatus Binatia bacterium]|nr:sulfatase-like hydrolase/transferase [Candidatus Binatia bacterium]